MLRSIIKYISNDFVTLLGWTCPDYRTDINTCIVNSIYMRDLHQFLCLLNYVPLDQRKFINPPKVMRCHALYDDSDDEHNVVYPTLIDEDEEMLVTGMRIKRVTPCRSDTYCDRDRYNPNSKRVELLQLCVLLQYLEPVSYLLPDDISLIHPWLSSLGNIEYVVGVDYNLPILRILVEKYGQIVINNAVISAEQLEQKPVLQTFEEVFNSRHCMGEYTPDLAKSAYEYILENYDKPTQIPLDSVAVNVINAGVDIDINILRSLTRRNNICLYVTLSDYVRVLDNDVDDPYRMIEHCIGFNNKINTTIINALKDRLSFDQIVKLLSNNIKHDRYCVSLLVDTLDSYQQSVLLQRLTRCYAWNPMQLLQIMLTLTKIDKSVLELGINNHLGDLADYIEVKLK